MAARADSFGAMIADWMPVFPASAIIIHGMVGYFTDVGKQTPKLTAFGRKTGYYRVAMKLKDMLIAVMAVTLIGGLGLLWFAPSGLRQAPEVTVTTLKGQRIDVAGLRGRPLLVNFWATTCKACVEEIPHLAKLYQELAPQGLEIIGIAMAYDPPNRVVALGKARDIPYPLALDINSEAAMAFGNIRLTPTTFLIAPDGRVVHQKSGELDLQKVRALVMGMLARLPQDQAGETLAAR